MVTMPSAHEQTPTDRRSALVSKVAVEVDVVVDTGVVAAVLVGVHDVFDLLAAVVVGLVDVVNRRIVVIEQCHER